MLLVRRNRQTVDPDLTESLFLPDGDPMGAHQLQESQKGYHHNGYSGVGANKFSKGNFLLII